MKIVFIRHAKALDREIAFKKKISDADRPLTREGIAEFSKFIKKMPKEIGKIDLLITSPFVRAMETTKIVKKKVKVKQVVVDDVLSHGGSVDDVVDLLHRQPEKTIGVVGHEPELSSVISKMLGFQRVVLDFKKGAVCILKGKPGHFVITGLWNP